jgi:UPF0716 protein FxsA
LLGGVLLLTPGVLTDVVGIVFILPWSRRWIARLVRGAIDRRLAAGALRVAVMGVTGPQRGETVATDAEVTERAGPER